MHCAQNERFITIAAYSAFILLAVTCVFVVFSSTPGTKIQVSGITFNSSICGQGLLTFYNCELLTAKSPANKNNNSLFLHFLN